MLAVLDTNALIDLSRFHRTAESLRAYVKLAELLSRGEKIMTARISEAEFRVGPFRASDPVRELAKVNAILTQCAISEFDADAALLFAEVKAHLLNIGRPVGDMDIQIAAVALVNGQTLVTRNRRHFADVPGLRVESY